MILVIVIALVSTTAAGQYGTRENLYGPSGEWQGYNQYHNYLGRQTTDTYNSYGELIQRERRNAFGGSDLYDGYGEYKGSTRPGNPYYDW